MGPKQTRNSELNSGQRTEEDLDCEPESFPLVRIYPNDTAIMFSGLQCISTRQFLAQEGMCLHPDLSRRPAWFDRGKYEKAFMKRFLEIGDFVRTRRGKQLRSHGLDSWDIASMMLMVRVLVREVKHGHLQSPVENLHSKAERLLTRLEHARKRAKRHAIKLEGKELYDERQRHWQSFVRWMRVWILECECLDQRRRPRRKSANRLRIDLLVEWTRPELIDRGVPVPAEKQFRRLASLLISYVRRGRTPYDINELMKEPTMAAYRLAEFIDVRLERKRRRSSRR